MLGAGASAVEAAALVQEAGGCSLLLARERELDSAFGQSALSDGDDFVTCVEASLVGRATAGHAFYDRATALEPQTGAN